MLPIVPILFLAQQADELPLGLGGIADWKYPPIMRAARIQGDIELKAVIKDGEIVSISANKPDPPNARPVIRECSEKVLRSIKIPIKVSGTIRVHFIYKLTAPTNGSSSRVIINPDRNEIIFEASALLSAD